MTATWARPHTSQQVIAAAGAGTEAGWAHALRVTAPALAIAPPTFLDDLRANLVAEGVRDAVARHETAPIFDWWQRLIPLQGISDAAAFAHLDTHGIASWADITARLASTPSCPKLRSYWHFADCGYRKSSGTCAEPWHQPRCPLPTHPLRKGSLNRASYGLHLFIRDVCTGDLVGWLDQRLADADPSGSAPTRAAALRDAVLEPLAAVHGLGKKVMSMMLADLLLAGDPERGRWVSAGAGMIAVDTLVHNFLHRTGILRRFGAEHAYGDACYRPGGCVSLLEGLALRIDAREVNPDSPAYFPRFVQHAIWRFCAGGIMDICNGNRIDDRTRCGNRHCPASRACDRVCLLARLQW